MKVRKSKDDHGRITDISVTLASGRRVDVFDHGVITVAEPLQAEHGVSGKPVWTEPAK